jgi:GTP-binding protein
VPTYEGMILGEHNLENDMEMNAAKEKETSNVRVGGFVKVEERLQAPKYMGLEECIAYIRPDELVEVTPKHIRMRKKILSQSVREKIIRD